MASIPTARTIPLSEYRTGDGKPVGETPVHRDNLLELIDQLRRHFAGDHSLYISGNMFLYYVPNDKRRHVSPDVFVTRGIPDTYRAAYFTWVEGKGPDFVVEFTSPTTRREDLRKKFDLYQDVLKVREYFLFDPFEEYLKPSMRGYRLVEGRYVAIEPVEGRLPSEVTGLHLERVGVWLRLHDPATGRRVLTRLEAATLAEQERDDARHERDDARHERDDARQAARQAEEIARQAEEIARQAEEAARQAEEAARQADAENARLRAELEELRRRRG
jgi:Uma2 family endonuclease